MEGENTTFSCVRQQLIVGCEGGMMLGMDDNTKAREEFSTRLKQAMKARDYADNEMVSVLSRWTGLTYEAARKWVEAMSIPRKGTIHKICVKLNCREEWLEYGVGPMTQEKYPDPRIDEVLRVVERQLLAAAAEGPDALDRKLLLVEHSVK